MISFPCQHCSNPMEMFKAADGRWKHVKADACTFCGPVTNGHVYHFCNFLHFIAWVQDYVRAEIEAGTMSVPAMEARKY